MPKENEDMQPRGGQSLLNESSGWQPHHTSPDGIEVEVRAKGQDGKIYDLTGYYAEGFWYVNDDEFESPDEECLEWDVLEWRHKSSAPTLSSCTERSER